MYIIPPRNLSLLSLTPILHSTKVTTPPGTPTTVTAALAPSTTTSLCSCFQDTAANNQGTNSVYFHDEASAAACQLEKENVHLTDLMPFLPTRYSHQVHNDSQEVASGKSDRISVRTTPGTKLPDQSAAELATPLSSPQALSGNLTTCPSIELIFARGTNESPGLGRIGTALFIELQRFFPDMTAYGVFYSAPTYKGRFLSGDNLESGAIDVVDRVSMWEEQKEVGLCPETRIVLGGFSLGAAVMQKADLTATQQDLVDAVVIFGYPWHFRSKSAPPYPIPAEKVWTRCISQDPVCNKDSIFSDGTFKAHNIYGGYVWEAVDFVLRRLGLI